MYSCTYTEIPFNEIPDWSLVGEPEWTDSVYQDGIKNAVLLATWEGKLCLIGGNRRILSLKAARARAEEDGTLADRPWLDTLKALVYADVPLAVQSAWAIQDNEQRSDNPLHLYSVIKAAMSRHDWDEVYALSKLNKKRFEQAMEYDNLTPDLFQMVVQGRMSKTNALAAARLGARQDYLEQLAKAKGDNARITGKDISAAQQARTAAVLQTLTPTLVPTQQTVVSTNHVMFLVVDENDILDMRLRGYLKDDFHGAFEAATEGGKMLFRLQEV